MDALVKEHPSLKRVFPVQQTTINIRQDHISHNEPFYLMDRLYHKTVGMSTVVFVFLETFAELLALIVTALC